MGESFTIQISSNLVKQLADDGETSKRKIKRSKPKIPREPQQSQSTVHPKQISGDSEAPKLTPPVGWPVQPPLFMPITPPPQAACPELDAIRSVVQESEKVLERLQKQEEVMVQEVTERAKDLHDKEFKLPNQKTPPCLMEKGACFDCYKEHVKDPLKCADLVKNYADCIRRDRQQDIVTAAGTDTSAAIVEWVMAEIMHKPEVMKKVQEELSDVIGTNNMVEEPHLPKLHYLDAVVKETFRLHPPLPFLLPKRPDKSCIVGGYTIPKDTRELLNVWAMQRDPEVWDSPLEFKPERFLGEASKWDYNGNNFQYLPFGSGRRVCAGLPLAEKMIMYFLASLLHSFNWRLPEGEEVDLSETFGIVMKKKTPLVAIPTQR